MHKLFASIACFMCFSVGSGHSLGMNQKEKDWYDLRLSVLEFMAYLYEDRQPLKRYLSRVRGTYRHTGLGHSVYIKNILPEIYCTGCSSCCDRVLICPPFRKLPYNVWKRVSCGQTNQREGISGIVARDDFNYCFLLALEEKAQKFHFGEYDKNRNLVFLKWGQFGDKSAALEGLPHADSAMSPLLSTGMGDSDNPIIVFQKYDERDQGTGIFLVYDGSKGILSENEYSWEELNNKFNGGSFIQIYHNPDKEELSGAFVGKKPKGDVKVAKVKMKGLKLVKKGDILSDTETRLLLNFYDQDKNPIRQSCIDVPYAKDQGENFGDCLLMDIEEGDVFITAVIVDVDAGVLERTLIQLAELLAKPLVSLIEKAGEKFSLLGVFEDLLTVVSDDLGNLVDSTIKVLKDAAKDDPLDAFELNLTKLEELDKVPKTQLRKKLTLNSGRVYLKLLYPNHGNSMSQY